MHAVAGCCCPWWRCSPSSRSSRSRWPRNRRPPPRSRSAAERQESASALPPGAFSPDEGPRRRHLSRAAHHAALQPRPGHLTRRWASPARRATQGVRHASAQDVLLPKGSTCDACHDTDHDDLKAVKPGKDPPGQCSFCHLGYKASDGNAVAALEMPRAKPRLRSQVARGSEHRLRPVSRGPSSSSSSRRAISSAHARLLSLPRDARFGVARHREERVRHVPLQRATRRADRPA